MIRKILKKIVDTYIFTEVKLIPYKQKGKKLLLFRKDGLGDFLLFLPTISEYKKIFPDHTITLVLPSVAKDFINTIPCVDEYIVFDNKAFSKNMRYRRDFIRQIRQGGFDVAIYPVYSPEAIVDRIIGISGAREKIAWNGDLYSHSQTQRVSRHQIYTKLIEKIFDNTISEVIRNEFFIKSLGGNMKIIFPTILRSDEHAKVAKEILDANKIFRPFAFIFPSSGAIFRNWEPAKFAEIIDFISSKNVMCVVYDVRNTTSNNSATDIIKIHSKSEFVWLSEYINLLTLAEILRESCVCFGTDTGVTHLAAAVGTPVVSITGIGEGRGRFFPYGDLSKNIAIFSKTATCAGDHWECAKNLATDEIAPCISSISTDEVKPAILDIIQRCSK